MMWFLMFVSIIIGEWGAYEIGQQNERIATCRKLRTEIVQRVNAGESVEVTPVMQDILRECRGMDPENDYDFSEYETVQ
jgi:hypothetical protein